MSDMVLFIVVDEITVEGINGFPAGNEYDPEPFLGMVHLLQILLLFTRMAHGPLIETT